MNLAQGWGMQLTTGKWLCVMALVGASAWACSDDDGEPPKATGGSSGTGGKGGAGGKGGLGGAGGSPAGAGGTAGGAGGTAAGAGGSDGESCLDDQANCPDVDACGPLPLAELCSARPAACPSLDELTEYCSASHAKFTSRELSCGGQIVIADYGLGRDTWAFDANGTLTYKRVDSDLYDICPDHQGASASTMWGELPCSATGAAAPLCNAGGAGGSGGEGGGGGAGAGEGGGAGNGGAN